MRLLFSFPRISKSSTGSNFITRQSLIKLQVSNDRLNKLCGGKERETGLLRRAGRKKLIFCLLTLADAENKPERQDAGDYEQQIDQLPMPHPPARQSESYADQHMCQEEEDQIQVKLCVHISRLLQGQQCPVPPGVSRDEEDDHEDEKHPGADPVYLDKKSASLQSKFSFLSVDIAIMPLILPVHEHMVLSHAIP